MNELVGVVLLLNFIFEKKLMFIQVTANFYICRCWTLYFVLYISFFILIYQHYKIQVLDATSDEPWGPHGSALLEIAQASKKL